jgi:IS1 family transposase
MKFGHSYIKNKNVKPNDPQEYGDYWTYTAFKKDSGFFLTFSCGKRTYETCKEMLDNLYYGINIPFPKTKIKFSTDGNFQYENLIKELYAETCITYGKVIKTKKENNLVEINFEHVLGDPSEYKISTSVVEGYNNKFRQKISCFGRKTAAFQKLTNSYISKINLFQFANNFIEGKFERFGLERVKIRTPAMIEGIADRVWTWMDFLKCNAVRIKSS